MFTVKGEGNPIEEKCKALGSTAHGLKLPAISKVDVIGEMIIEFGSSSSGAIGCHYAYSNDVGISQECIDSFPFVRYPLSVLNHKYLKMACSEPLSHSIVYIAPLLFQSSQHTVTLLKAIKRRYGYIDMNNIRLAKDFSDIPDDSNVLLLCDIAERWMDATCIFYAELIDRKRLNMLNQPSQLKRVVEENKFFTLLFAQFFSLNHPASIMLRSCDSIENNIKKAQAFKESTDQPFVVAKDCTGSHGGSGIQVLDKIDLFSINKLFLTQDSVILQEYLPSQYLNRLWSVSSPFTHEEGHAIFRGQFDIPTGSFMHDPSSQAKEVPVLSDVEKACSDFISQLCSAPLVDTLINLHQWIITTKGEHLYYQDIMLDYLFSDPSSLIYFNEQELKQLRDYFISIERSDLAGQVPSFCDAQGISMTIIKHEFSTQKNMFCYALDVFSLRLKEVVNAPMFVLDSMLLQSIQLMNEISNPVSKLHSEVYVWIARLLLKINLSQQSFDQYSNALLALIETIKPLKDYHAYRLDCAIKTLNLGDLKIILKQLPQLPLDKKNDICQSVSALYHDGGYAIRPLEGFVESSEVFQSLLHDVVQTLVSIRTAVTPVESRSGKLTAPVTSQSSLFQPGQNVIISGLQSEEGKKLNDLAGTIVEEVTSERYQVRIERSGGRSCTRNIKPCHLRLR